MYFNDSKTFLEYLNNMNSIYKNIEEYKPNKKRKLLIVFDDMIANMFGNKKINSILTELFVRGIKSIHFLCFYHTIRFESTKPC